MQFNKTLKTLLRAKQEGQNDSYKAGFNDALALLDQEEQHIEFERQLELNEQVNEHFHGEEPPHKYVEESKHEEVEHLEEKIDEIAQETVSELALFKDEVKEDSSTEYVAAPKVQIEPESVSFDEEIGGDLKNQEELHPEKFITQSKNQLQELYDEDLIADQGFRVGMIDDDKEIDKPVAEDVEENILKDKHITVGDDVHLDDEEMKKHRQLAAIAEARRKAKEEEDEDE